MCNVFFVRYMKLKLGHNLTYFVIKLPPKKKNDKTMQAKIRLFYFWYYE